VVEQLDAVVFEGGLEAEDNVRFGGLGGEERGDIQTTLQEVINDWLANAVDFHHDEIEVIVVVDLGDPGFQLRIIDTIETGKVDLFLVFDIHDGYNREISGSGHVDGGHVAAVGLGGLDLEGGDGFYIAEDGAVFLNELGKVFLTEDFIGGGTAGKFNLGGVDEGI